MPLLGLLIQVCPAKWHLNLRKNTSKILILTLRDTFIMHRPTASHKQNILRFFHAQHPPDISVSFLPISETMPAQDLSQEHAQDKQCSYRYRQSRLSLPPSSSHPVFCSHLRSSNGKSPPALPF